jgi:hypothetical protein
MILLRMRQGTRFDVALLDLTRLWLNYAFLGGVLMYLIILLYRFCFVSVWPQFLVVETSKPSAWAVPPYTGNLEPDRIGL